MPENFERQIKADLKSMDQRLEDLEGKMTSIDTKLTQVVDAILGNTLTKEGGVMNDIKTLKGKIKTLEEKLEQQEAFKNKVLWTIAILVTIGLVIQYILNIYVSLNKVS